MKKPSSILNHLFPNNKKYQLHRCFYKLFKALPPKMRERIAYIYQKNSILYFVLSHPGYVMEFNYNKKVINDVLNLLQKNVLECKELQYNSIKAYAKFIPPKPLQPPKPIQTYRERAKGEFEIYPENEKLKELLLQIKEAIKKNGS